MNALRLAGADRLGELEAATGPLILYTNHPGWWDGALYVMVAQRLFPQRRHYAPIDSAMLDKYRFFGRIGGYGVAMDSRRGAAAFLADSRRILSSTDSLLWISGQGRFSDPRHRPLGLKPGVARLCEAAPNATVAPVAIEYAFWSERGSEAFVRIGTPIAARDLAAIERAPRLQKLEASLAETLDLLSADVMAREPQRFHTLLDGRPGVGGVYDLWKGAAARLSGRRWSPAHAEPAVPDGSP